MEKTEIHDNEREISLNDELHQTKSGKSYSPGLRKLYYNLLVSGMPPGSIHLTIKKILHHFLPNIDTCDLNLPKQSCAQYMRSEELKTVNDVHKAIKLTEKPTNFHFNSDGTTLKQHKIAAATINGLVLSVNEVPDGTAEQIARDMSCELDHLRKTAKALDLPNADCINWGAMTSITSDSAATQKKFNSIAKTLKEEDIQRFRKSPSDNDCEKIVDNLCAMHLGVNLRKAFLQASNAPTSEATARQYSETDTIVHEFCKVFGNKGVPEYGIGATSFPDFLEIGIKTFHGHKSEYYRDCMSVKLERQVGSRYFVSASNAAKLLYLRSAACDYLKHFKRNKLEKDVYEKLHNDNIMAGVKADGLMFVHIYADLVTLAKSQQLDKSALDMNIHYLKLDGFLEELEADASIALDPYKRVFTSEKRLYDDPSINHRQRHANTKVYGRLFSPDPTWDQLLQQKLCKGAEMMRCKLHVYAKDYLPSGKYWDPPDDVKDILQQIRPSNDICESILGLNDWLQSTMTNVSQRTKRNLIEAKKNKSLPWLDIQATEEQHKVIEMATKQRETVKNESKKHIASIKDQRQQSMMKTISKQKNKEMRLEHLKRELSSVLIVIDKDHLDSILKEIDDDKHMSGSQKVDKKRELLKMQLKIRKTMLGQNVKMYFTKSGKTVPLLQLISEFKDILESNPLPSSFSTHATPQLVGKKISHRFYNKKKKEYIWYSGLVMNYDDERNEYEVAYADEEQHSFFNILIDYATGDLKITN